MKNTCYIGFEDRWLRLLGIPLLSLLIPPLFFREFITEEVTYWHNVAISLIYTTAIWEGNRWIFILVTRRFPDWHDWKKRLVRIVLICFIFTGLVCQVVKPVLQFLDIGFLKDFHGKGSLVAEYGASYLLLFAMGAVYESMRFFNLWKETLVEKEQVERAHLASQLEGLRNQVNPHFLFNSLNTLIYLIPEEPAKAVRFVQQLSKVYRYVLESRDAKVISLGDELEFLKSYIFLLKERFGENLDVAIQPPDPSPKGAIVPLSLQLLFENAIKHNVISTEKPLRIEVFAENGHLVIRNNLQRKNQVMDSTGVGLDNIRTRYRLLTDRNVEVIASPKYFTVLLPLLET
jgi:two-component system LytT family sensor kinase